jgi:hypothetical protein
VGTRALGGFPGAGRPRIEHCADEHRQQQRTQTNQQRQHFFSSSASKGRARHMAKLRPKPSEALRIRSGPLSPAQRKDFPTFGGIPDAVSRGLW